MAFAVGQRKHEIGIRMALGASRDRVVRMILREGATMAGAGLVLGLGGAYFVGRAMRSTLYSVGTVDVSAFCRCGLLLLASALVACYFPARRAAAVEPMQALENRITPGHLNLEIGVIIMIELKNVERSYKTGHTETWVLRRIGLTINEGEFVTVMGPSGAGKSSLLNVLALLDDGWLGEYWFGETPAHKLNRKQRADLARQRIGMVFQSYHLLDDLTVAENIDLPLSYKNLPAKERAGHGGRHSRPLSDRRQEGSVSQSQLSGGQQQLVGIARAVVHAPALLLADEPTGNLHSTQAREIMELFRELNRQGTTIVQVTHSEENARYGKRILELRDGWLTRDETLAGQRQRRLAHSELFQDSFER